MQIDISRLSFIDKNLRAIVVWLEAELGLNFIVTSLYRPADPGVHGQLPLRGMDLRCRNEALGQLIADLVNDVWIYDSTRPLKKCAIYHDVGKGKHLHLQVHPRTGRRR